VVAVECVRAYIEVIEVRRSSEPKASEDKYNDYA